MSSSTAWSTYQALGQLGLQGDPISKGQKKQNKTKTNLTYVKTWVNLEAMSPKYVIVNGRIEFRKTSKFKLLSSIISVFECLPLITGHAVQLAHHFHNLLQLTKICSVCSSEKQRARKRTE